MGHNSDGQDSSKAGDFSFFWGVFFELYRRLTCEKVRSESLGRTELPEEPKRAQQVQAGCKQVGN